MSISLSRIILYSGNTSLLRDFYQRQFGFRILEEIPDEWVVLETGKIEIALHRVGKNYRNDEKFIAQSNAKLVFSIDSNLEGLRDKLIENGVAMKSIKSYDKFNYMLCDGEDPEGNIFQLMAAKN